MSNNYRFSHVQFSEPDTTHHFSVISFFRCKFFPHFQPLCHHPLPQSGTYMRYVLPSSSFVLHFFSWVMVCVCFTKKLMFESGVTDSQDIHPSIYLSPHFVAHLCLGNFSLRAFWLSLNLPISSKTLSITFAVSFVIDFFVWVKVLLASFSLRPWMCISKMVCCIWWN